jgi:hypothetical protein
MSALIHTSLNGGEVEEAEGDLGRDGGWVHNRGLTHVKVED